MFEGGKERYKLLVAVVFSLSKKIISSSAEYVSHPEHFQKCVGNNSVKKRNSTSSKTWRHDLELPAPILRKSLTSYEHNECARRMPDHDGGIGRRFVAEPLRNYTAWNVAGDRRCLK